MNIANIPDHLLLKVFKMLDKTTIEKISTVCQSWNEIISSSPILMKRLEVVLNIKTKSKLDESMKKLQNLPYKNISIRPKFHQESETLDILKDNLKQREDSIEQIEFFLASASTITGVLSHLRCDKITTLKMTQSFPEEIAENVKIELPNLKCLEVYQASAFLKMIKVHNLEILKIIHAYDDYYGVNEKVNNFLVTCNNLKSLVFEKYLPVLTVEKFKFKLTTLSLSNTENEKSYLNDRQLSAFKSLLDENAETLELLLIGNYCGINRLIEHFMPKMKKLSKLFLICPTIYTVDNTLSDNWTIKDLILILHSDCDKNLRKTQKIIRHSRAVEELDLRSTPNDMSALVVQASHSMKNLKKLSINVMKGNFRNLEKFENLEELSIERLFEQNDLKAFMILISNAPKLRKLKIRYWGCDKTPFLSKGRLTKLLTYCKNLETLQIGGFFKLPNTFVDTLVEVQSNLKHLIIETCMPDEIVGNFKKINENTRIKCTALQWVSEKKQIVEDENMDLQDYDIENDSSDESSEDNGPAAWLFNSDDDQLDDSSEEDDDERDDRFNKSGLRRSKRLRLI